MITRFRYLMFFIMAGILAALALLILPIFKDTDITIAQTGMGILLEKSTNGQDADTAPAGPFILVGDTVTWRYQIQNTGIVPLTNISLEDSDLGPVICDEGPIPDLDLNETFTCTTSGTATAGQYSNTGTVIAGDPNQTLTFADSDDSHYFGFKLDIRFEKRTNGQLADTPTGPYIPVDDPVNWSYEVENKSNVPLTNIQVTDDDPGVTVDCPKKSLDPDEIMTCTASGVATTGQYANIGTVTARGPAQSTVSDSNPSHYFGSAPGISVEKTADVSTANVGETITYDYTVTNIGNVTLTSVSLTDNKLGPISLETNTLAPGASTVGSATYVVTENDLPGPLGNTATAQGTPPPALQIT